MPQTKVLDIEKLQPTDTLRVETLSFLESLSPEEIQNLELPQVWKTSLGILISDGNHRATILAKKGQKQIKVDYNEAKGISAYEDDFFDTIQDRARQLQSQRIYTVMDLLQT